MSLLIPLADDLWTYSQPLRVMGMALGHRMTVIRLGGSSLWVHSPVQWSRELGRELAELGEVRHVVAPNLHHDLWLLDWRQQCRTALLWGAPGLQQRQSQSHTHITGDLTDAPHPEWEGVIDQTILHGAPRFNEVVFLHSSTRTLIVADMFFNLRGDLDFMTSLMSTLNGCRNRFAVPRNFRAAISDKASFAASTRRIFGWNFDRIVPGHGEIVETGGLHLLVAALDWLPGAFPAPAV